MALWNWHTDGWADPGYEGEISANRSTGTASRPTGRSEIGR